MKFVLTVLLAASFWMSGFAQGEGDPNMGIIPVPISVKRAKGDFNLTSETIVIADATSERGVKFFMDALKKMGLAIRLTDKNNIDKNSKSLKNVILLTSNTGAEQPIEGYELNITEEKIVLSGKGSGLFYGVQTLIQLIEKKKQGTAIVPCGAIKDYPRFGYRGMHLDVARHFFDVDFIKKYIDVMAAYKLNYFHWHLTDDQGWRIEIKKYPKLTEVGSVRAQTKVGGSSGNDSDLYDNTLYSGFYTQDEVKEVIEYARDRYIDIIPEIEMPGHSMAAIAAYPELSCDEGGSYKVGETWGIYTDVMCPSETTFKMLDNILDEIITLFPCKYIHIGGDECPKDAWRKSLFCQNLIRELRLRDENELQSYFMTRIEKFVNARNRTVIGWDEILEGGVAPNAVVMSWRGESGGIAAAQLNHDVIMTPATEGLYFDHAQSKSPQEPLCIGGNAPLALTYKYDPIPAELNAEQRKHILGVQANLWTEYIATPEKAEYMLLPRMLALSEVAWSVKNRKDFTNFNEQRVPKHLAKLEEAGYNFRVPEPLGADDTSKNGANFRIALKNSVEGAKIHYTIDGFFPRETDLTYTSPIKLTVPKGKYIDLQTITITKTGKRSRVTHYIMDNGGMKDREK
jgi:hexosaminidase